MDTNFTLKTTLYSLKRSLLTILSVMFAGGIVTAQQTQTVTTEQCYLSPTKSECVNARVVKTVNTNNTTTIRVIFSKCFVDNTYGTNAVGWGNKGHTFQNLVGSDRIQIQMHDQSGVKRMDITLDYISEFKDKNTNVTTWRSGGVADGEGDVDLGNESDVVAWKTSLDKNFNDYGYVLTTNSPATDANYTPNPSYPNWIYEVWYEVTVKNSAFGGQPVGNVLIPYVHASPSKTGSNTETVNPGPCPKTIRLGNLVFRDLNNDGDRDSGEPGVSGATVRLYADANGDNVADGATISTTTTDANGNYSFFPLDAGNYIVGVVLPSGLTKGDNGSSTPNNDIDNDNNGVVLSGSEVRSNSITLSASNEPPLSVDGDDANGNLTLDFGLKVQVVNNMNLGNLVWNDADGNGFKGGAEAGLPGVTVKLYRDVNGDNLPEGAAIQTTTTNGSGFYGFSGLDEGQYIVGVTLPANYTASVATASSLNPNNDTDNDNNGVTTTGGGEVLTQHITLTANAEPTGDGDGANGNLTLDVGLRAVQGTLTIGDYVWNDENGNGLQDANESGLPGATVQLTLPDGSTRQTTTDGSGYYYFTNLLPGTYNVCFSTPAGYRPTTPNAGADDRDSDPVNGCVSVTINNAPGNLTVDAGFTLIKLNLGNLVYYDVNGNGTLDMGEPGLASMTVNLYRDVNGDNTPDGATISTTTTNSQGFYSFTGLTQGNYIVSVDLGEVWSAGAIAPTGLNPNNNVDSDNNGIITLVNKVYSAHITLTGGAEPTTDGDGADGNLTLDFGLAQRQQVVLNVLGNKIFKDLNENGVLNTGEPGISGLRVNLYEDNDANNIPDGAAVDFTFTAADGTYNFNNLDDGNYIIGVILPAPANNKVLSRGPISVANANNDVDNDNNGIRDQMGEVFTNRITLAAGTEPPIGVDGDDTNGNMTLDIGLIESTNIILPLTLLDFSGTATGNTSMLKWKVANESQMDYYAVEKSQDGSNFTVAGKVSALNGTSAQVYGYNDQNSTGSSVLYYRLRNVDQRGNYSYSNVVALRFGNLGKSVLTLYPNPVRDYAVLNLNLGRSANADLQLVGAGGQVIYRKSFRLNAGSNAMTMDGLGRFTAGTYNVTITLDNGEQFQHKLVIAH